MAEVDTSIYKNQTPPLNPLTAFGQVVGIANAQGQNRLLQQQQDLRAGMGDAIRGAVDPETGKVDTNKLLATVGQDPRTAWNFGDVNAQTQGNVTATAQAEQEQLKNGLAHTQAANGIISGVLGNPNLGKTDMRDQIVNGVFDLVDHSGGKLTAKMARDTIIPSIPADPAGQLQWVRDKANQNLALQGKLEQVLGTPTMTNTGPSIVQTRTPTAGGPMTTTGALGTATDPTTRAQLVPTFVQQADGTYQQVMVPRGSLPGASGVFPGGGTSAPPVAPTPPAATAAPATLPPFDANRPAPGQVQPGTAPGAAGAILAAPPPGVTESQQADVTKYKADQALIPEHATNVQSLQKAQVALEALQGPLGTGKGTDTLAHLKSVMSSLGIGFNDSTLNRDEAKKYLTDYARKQGAAAHSDLQLEAAQGSNASTDISNAAALDVVKTNIGRERQAIAQVQEHANPTGIGYGSHASSFATKTDPRAFAWNEYSHEEQQKIIGSLSAPAKAKLVASLKIASKYGFVQPEGANGGQ